MAVTGLGAFPLRSTWSRKKGGNTHRRIPLYPSRPSDSADFSSTWKDWFLGGVTSYTVTVTAAKSLSASISRTVTRTILASKVMSASKSITVTRTIAAAKSMASSLTVALSYTVEVMAVKSMSASISTNLILYRIISTAKSMSASVSSTFIAASGGASAWMQRLWFGLVGPGV